MLKKLLMSSFIATVLFSATAVGASASTYTVKSGDSLWEIGKKYGVSVKDIQSLNNKRNHLIFPGETLKLPKAVTASEKELMARLVHAEAKGESYAGKVAVATVILNRVDSDSFPNTINGVVHERTPHGGYQFTPVQNGQINLAADKEAMKAVEEAIAFRGQGKGSLYFYNPAKTNDQWIRTRAVTTTIGNHVFAK
ncbi:MULTISPECIES: cell wall hydrolase [Sutcliffiella]|uniref:Peptidoglycan-binding protein n=1 Tax=Sutcliffiella cohnii TaxID=33932 RepID=A0A223KQR6_9BACI|nr:MULTISPECIES: cell wall hydrolase [Sutcliffiella]AST91819.1 peptidoglycan-binding protein [Sutcliffiella cohnii]MED4018626.1 cell wall hydrolase [Sutcliffiella cohnii]WBL13039.1 cell wall hydrolase [Sutcliffiella sp. NC1]